MGQHDSSAFLQAAIVQTAKRDGSVWQGQRWSALASALAHGSMRNRVGASRPLPRVHTSAQVLVRWFGHFGAATCPACRYFLRKLRKVKKANGQILACNEVRAAKAARPLFVSPPLRCLFCRPSNALC